MFLIRNIIDTIIFCEKADIYILPEFCKKFFEKVSVLIFIFGNHGSILPPFNNIIGKKVRTLEKIEK